MADSDDTPQEDEAEGRRLTHEELVREVRQLRQKVRQQQDRLDHLDQEAMLAAMQMGAPPPSRMRPSPVYVLAVRLNALLDAAFGPIDYEALDDTARTSVERLVFEHSFEERLHLLNRQALSTADRRATGIVTPPSGLTGPDGRPLTN